MSRTDGHGLHVRLDDSGRTANVAQVPIAPGLVVSVGIAEHRRIELGEAIELERRSGSLALDGEREHELTSDNRVVVTLATDGPQLIDVDAVMSEASRRGLLVSAR